MKEKIKKMPGRIRNYFCSHMSAQVTVTVVLLLILAGLVLQIYVKNQYFNYLLRNTRSMEESMIETSTINIDANLKDIISRKHGSRRNTSGKRKTDIGQQNG